MHSHNRVMQKKQDCCENQIQPKIQKLLWSILRRFSLIDMINQFLEKIKLCLNTPNHMIPHWVLSHNEYRCEVKKLIILCVSFPVYTLCQQRWPTSWQEWKLLLQFVKLQKPRRLSIPVACRCVHLTGSPDSLSPTVFPKISTELWSPSKDFINRMKSNLVFPHSGMNVVHHLMQKEDSFSSSICFISSSIAISPERDFLHWMAILQEYEIRQQTFLWPIQSAMDDLIKAKIFHTVSMYTLWTSFRFSSNAPTWSKTKYEDFLSPVVTASGCSFRWMFGASFNGQRRSLRCEFQRRVAMW